MEREPTDHNAIARIGGSCLMLEMLLHRVSVAAYILLLSSFDNRAFAVQFVSKIP
jgi:hypothetical protein